MSDRTESRDPSRPTFRLMYRSHSLLPRDGRRQELGGIFSTARSNNKRLGVTGALLVSEDCFVQSLEGDETVVRALYGRIAADPRHEDVTLLEAGDVQGRVFARWAMAQVSQDGEPDLPLIAGQRGATPAAGHPTTPEQDAVLDRMRAAVHGSIPA